MRRSETKGFEVQWCTDMPAHPEGGADVDRATYEVRDFPNHGLALAFARRIKSQDVYGAPHIRPFVEDRYGCRDIDHDRVEEISE
jgi:hypothetical protein